MCSWRSRHFAAGHLPLPTAPELPIVCYVTGRNALGPSASIANLLEKIGAAAEAGTDWIQIREKDLPAGALLALVQEAVRIVKSCGRNALVIVNDRLDVALAAGAAGVHLGGDSAPASEVIRWCRAGNAPADFRVGVSCHNAEEARVAESDGANYIFFGPIYDTPSKRSFGPPQGIARLEEVCRALRIPVIAIGGVDEKNAGACIRAGAAGIAAIRMFQEAKDVNELKSSVTRVHQPA